MAIKKRSVNDKENQKFSVANKQIRANYEGNKGTKRLQRICQHLISSKINTT